MDFTPIAKPFMAKVFNRETKAREDAERSQRATLQRLIGRMAKTEWGKERGITPDVDYETFAQKVQPAGYEAFQPYIERMIQGETDILVPGRCLRYAQSSGTSGSKSKYIPLPDKALKENHYVGAAYSLASYLHHYPDSKLFAGKNFILGGSYGNEIEGLAHGVKVGDLSASLIDRINPLVNLFRIPDKRTALMEDWTEKLPRLVDASVNEDVRSISGVPSWFLTVLKGVAERRKEQGFLSPLWPNLEVFFHGGIAFGPYKEQYRALCNPKMRYWENYNASEGFFAVQELPAESPHVRLFEGTKNELNREAMPMGFLLSAGIFYEFLPLEESQETQSQTQDFQPLPLWKVETGKVYELVITAPNGLTRYRIGDTVKVCSTNPVTIVIAGRTKAFINAFGEELMVHNAEAAMTETCRHTGAEVADYTAAPIYTSDGSRGRHQWLIEFAKRPANISEFAEILDSQLQKVNSDYQAKRSGNIFLDPLEIVEAESGLFNRWLAQTGKLGGQRKVPRLANNRKLIDKLLEINKP